MMIDYISWQEGAALIAQVNPEFSQVIEDLHLSKQYQLIKVRYPWGASILKDNELFLPNHYGKIVNIHDVSIPEKLKRSLNYNHSVPLGIVLHNTLESYIDTGERTIPFGQFSAGRVFGLWSSLERQPCANAMLNTLGKISNLIAGTHLPIVLPKISDHTAFKRLQRYFRINEAAPKDMRGHLRVLSACAQHEDFPEPWYAEVIFFTDPWITIMQETRASLFHNYLLNAAWSGVSHTVRNQSLFDVTFSCALRAEQLTPKAALVDTTKFLHLLAQGTYPGFKVAKDSSVLPKQGLQKLLNEFYGLRYVPHLLHPSYVGTAPLYYSLAMPISMSFSPDPKKISNKLEELREVAYIMRLTLNYLQTELTRFKTIPHWNEAYLYRAAYQVKFSYFHTETDRAHHVLKTSQIPATDQALQADIHTFSSVPFCDSSPFLRGCIQLVMT